MMTEFIGGTLWNVIGVVTFVGVIVTVLYCWYDSERERLAE